MSTLTTCQKLLGIFLFSCWICESLSGSIVKKDDLQPSVYYKLSNLKENQQLHQCTKYPISELDKQSENPWNDFVDCKGSIADKNVDMYDPIQRICFSTMYNIFQICSQSGATATTPSLNSTNKSDLTLEFIQNLKLDCETLNNGVYLKSCTEDDKDCQRNEKNMKELSKYCQEACFNGTNDKNQQPVNVCKHLMVTMNILTNQLKNTPPPPSLAPRKANVLEPPSKSESVVKKDNSLSPAVKKGS